MSISPVSATSQAPAHARPSATPAPSTAVQTAAQEAAETPVQTAQEASKGDAQARRMMSMHSSPPTVNTSGQSIGNLVNTKA